MLVVSFTTIPPRFKHLGRFFASLEAQTSRPDRVELTLPRSYRRYPGARPDLPPLPDWIEVFEVDHDLGPSTKIIPALRRWQGRDIDLLYCDDDKSYDPGWVARMCDARMRKPGHIICERGCDITAIDPSERTGIAEPRAVPSRERRVSETTLWHDSGYRPASPFARSFDAEGYLDIMFGFGGVLARPDSFHDDVFEDPGVLWPVDDIWLSGMAAAKGTGVWATAEPLPSLVLSEVDRVDPLYLMASDGLARKDLNWLGVAWFRDAYGIWS